MMPLANFWVPSVQRAAYSALIGSAPAPLCLLSTIMVPTSMIRWKDWSASRLVNCRNDTLASLGHLACLWARVQTRQGSTENLLLIGFIKIFN